MTRETCPPSSEPTMEQWKNLDLRLHLRLLWQYALRYGGQQNSCQQYLCRWQRPADQTDLRQRGRSQHHLRHPGQEKTATYADGKILSYVYNGEGRVHSLTETNGSSVTTYLYTYDSIGRLIYSEQKENGLPGLRASQSYNANNQLTGQSWQVIGIVSIL